MKTLILISFILFLSQALSQTPYHEVLDFNNSHTQSSDNGFLFMSNDTVDGYKMNKDSLQKFIYSSAFWFGGIGDNNELKMCAQDYHINGSDQSSGPYSTLGSYSSQAYLNKYENSIWTISGHTIQNHIDDFNNPGYTVPSIIMNWPAHGDTTLGVNYYLAPFVDTDNNGVYEPENGDYPKIKGCKATYIITNDDAKIHDSGGEKLGIEIHYMIYQLTENSVYDDVTFIDLQVIKRANLGISDFTITYYADGDIGSGHDDYVGTSPSRNMMYFYNADDNDETQWGDGFGVNPPAFGIVCLNDNLTSSGQYISGNDEPTNYYEFWPLMNGQNKFAQDWKDENGYSTMFKYPGNPNDPNEFSAVSDNLTPNDFRAVMSLKPGELFQNDPIQRTFAIVPSSIGANNLDEVNELFSRVEILQIDFDNGNLKDCDEILNISEVKNSYSNLNVFPNPSDQIIQFKGLAKGKTSIIIQDMLGKVHLSTSLNEPNEKIDVSHLPKGIYTIQVNMSNNEVEILKLIKK